MNCEEYAHAVLLEGILGRASSFLRGGGRMMNGSGGPAIGPSGRPFLPTNFKRDTNILQMKRTGRSGGVVQNMGRPSDMPAKSASTSRARPKSIDGSGGSGFHSPLRGPASHMGVSNIPLAGAYDKFGSRGNSSRRSKYTQQ